MYIGQILLILGSFHGFVYRVVHSLYRVQLGLYRIRQQGLDRIGDGSRLLGFGCRLIVLLHTIESLVGGLGVLIQLLQQILGDGQVECLAR